MDMAQVEYMKGPGEGEMKNYQPVGDARARGALNQAFRTAKRRRENRISEHMRKDKTRSLTKGERGKKGAARGKNEKLGGEEHEKPLGFHGPTRKTDSSDQKKRGT